MYIPDTMQHNKLSVKVTTLGFLLLVLVNILPDELFHMVSIYNNATPSYISYKWLHYSFGVIDLALLLYGVYLIYKHRHKWIWTVLFILLLREFFYFLLSDFNAIKNESYEIFLSLLVGVALIEWQLQYGKDWEDNWNKFLIILMINVLSIYLNMILGRSGFTSRVNAVNLDVGTTGVLAGIAFIAMLFNEKSKYKILWAVIAAVGLVLSGSRINLLITLVLFILSIFINASKRLAEKKLFRFRITTLVIAIVLVGIVVFYGGALLSRFEASRIITIFNSDYLDDALSGRPASLMAGLNILKKKPLGISAYFTNLQYHTVQEGFVTFPHFGFLVQLILFGPLALIPLFFVIKSAVLLWKQKKWKILMPVLYLIIYNTVAGGPIVNPKIIYIFGCIFTIGWIASKDSNETVDSLPDEI